MTKEDLKQIPWLRQEIKLIHEELSNLPMTKDSVTGSRIGIPYDKHSIPIEGVDIKRWIGLQAKLQIKLDELQDKLCMMEDWLDSISDADMRVILRLKFRNGLSWDQVAANMDGKFSYHAIKKKVERFLKNLQ